MGPFPKAMRVAVAAALVFLTAMAVAADNSTPAGRQRLAILKALKAKGVVGENNKGLLEFRGAPSAPELLKAENDDRLKEYQEVAKRTKSTPAEVGRRRSLQLAEDAPSGAWVQKPNGAWERKP